MKTGMVLYTDGGANPTNPGPAGWGVHGYMYSTETPKKGAGNPNNVLTARGYVSKKDAQAAKELSPDKEVEQVTPLKYYDGYGSFPKHASNNCAEIVASINATSKALEFDIDELVLCIDSTYVKDAMEKWVKGWIQNNWVKKDQTPVQNATEFKLLYENIQRLRERGVKVSFEKVKGHSGNQGNDLADHGASAGCVRSRRMAAEGVGSFAADFTESDVDGYWKAEERNAYFGHRFMYYNTNTNMRTPGEYYFGNVSKEIEHTGKRIADGALSLVRMNEPDEILELVKLESSRMVRNDNHFVVTNVDKLLSKEMRNDISLYGGFALDQKQPMRADFEALDDSKELVQQDMTPSLIAWRVMEKIEDLAMVLDSYVQTKGQGDGDFTIVDITDTLYESTFKPAKPAKQKAAGKAAARGQTESAVVLDDAAFVPVTSKKRKASLIPTDINEALIKLGGDFDGDTVPLAEPANGETIVTLRPEFNVGYKSLKTTAGYKTSDGVEGSIGLSLVLGVDMPDRNALKRIEDKHPKVSVITWMEAPTAFRFATVVESDLGIGIWAGVYSNLRFITS